MSLGWVFYELCEFWISCLMICEKKGQGQKAQNREEIWKSPQKRSFPINWFPPYLSNRLAVTTFISIVLPQMSTMSWDLIMMEVGTSKRPNLVFKENVFNNLMGDMSMQVPHDIDWNLKILTEKSLWKYKNGILTNYEINWLHLTVTTIPVVVGV